MPLTPGSMDETALWRELFDEEDTAEAHVEPVGADDKSACRQCVQEDQQQSHQLGPPANTQPWPHAPPIPGLALIRGFLSSSQQELLLAAIHQEGWFTDPAANQAMRFGALPAWAQALAAAVPAHLLGPAAAGRVPLFDQLIANRYSRGEGLTPHVDLLRFQDGICVLSLGSPALMAFTPAPAPPSHMPTPHQQQHLGAPDTSPPHTTSHLQPPTHSAPAADTGVTCQPTTPAPGSSVHTQGASSCTSGSAAANLWGGSAGAGQQLCSSGAGGPPADGQLGTAGVPRGVRPGAPACCCHQVLLLAGDLLLLAGEARYGWCHGLADVEQEVLGSAAAAPYLADRAGAPGAARPQGGGGGMQGPGRAAAALPPELKMQGWPCDATSIGKQCVVRPPGVYVMPDGGVAVVRGPRVSVTLRALQPDCELCEPAVEDAQGSGLSHDGHASV